MNGQCLWGIILEHLLEKVVNVFPLFQGVLPVPPVLMAVWQQKKHGLLSRRVLERGLLAWGHTICLMACQCACACVCVSEQQPRNTCSESKFSPLAQDRSTSVYQDFCNTSLLAYKNIPSGFWSDFLQPLVCSNYFNSIAQIPDWPCPTPATALSTHNTLLRRDNGERRISERDTL